MANPALKNGYISIATELVDRLAMVNIPGNEMRIVWVLWRKTWGWKEGDRKKDWDWISYTQFEKLTGIKRRNCIDCIKSLVSKRILLCKENHYKFNQNYDEWVVSKRTPSVQKHTRVVSKRIQKVVSKSRPTIDTLKDTIQKKHGAPKARIVKDHTFSVEGAEIIKAFEDVDVKNKRYYKNTTQREACDFLISEYGIEKVLKVIEILPKTNQQTHFPSITSPYELVEKWQKLKDAFPRKGGEIKSKGRGFA